MGLTTFLSIIALTLTILTMFIFPKNKNWMIITLIGCVLTTLGCIVLLFDTPTDWWYLLAAFLWGWNASYWYKSIHKF